MPGCAHIGWFCLWQSLFVPRYMGPCWLWASYRCQGLDQCSCFQLQVRAKGNKEAEIRSPAHAQYQLASFARRHRCTKHNHSQTLNPILEAQEWNAKSVFRPLPPLLSFPPSLSLPLPPKPAQQKQLRCSETLTVAAERLATNGIGSCIAI